MTQLRSRFEGFFSGTPQSSVPVSEPAPESTLDPKEKEIMPFTPLEVTIDLSSLPEKHARLLREQDSALLRLPEKITLPKGVVLVIGANGSGKTTLLRGLSLALFPEQTAHLSDATRLRESLAHAFAQTLRVPDDRTALDIESSTLINAKGASHLSQRQGIDHMLKRQLRDIDTDMEISAGEPNGDLLLMVDEPELGMDPKRQKGLANEVQELLYFAPLVIVATNSPFLADSQLPRIDLTQPEKGVFWPQEELNKQLAKGMGEGFYPVE